MKRSSRRDSIVSLGYGLMRSRAATRAASGFGRAQLHHTYSRSCYSVILQNDAKPRSSMRVVPVGLQRMHGMVLRFAGILWSRREFRAHRELTNSKGAASTVCPGMAITLGPASDSSPDAGVGVGRSMKAKLVWPYGGLHFGGNYS